MDKYIGLAKIVAGLAVVGLLASSPKIYCSHHEFNDEHYSLERQVNHLPSSDIDDSNTQSSINLSTLPNATIINIASFLEQRHFFNFSRTCQKIHKACKSPQLYLPNKMVDLQKMFITAQSYADIRLMAGRGVITDKFFINEEISYIYESPLYAMICIQMGFEYIFKDAALLGQMLNAEGIFKITEFLSPYRQNLDNHLWTAIRSTFVKLEVMFPENHYYLGRLALTSGKYSKADRYLKIASENDTVHSQELIKIFRAVSALHQHKFDEADQLLQNKLYPSSDMTENFLKVLNAVNFRKLAEYNYHMIHNQFEEIKSVKVALQNSGFNYAIKWFASKSDSIATLREAAADFIYSSDWINPVASMEFYVALGQMQTVTLSMLAASIELQVPNNHPVIVEAQRFIKYLRENGVKSL